MSLAPQAYPQINDTPVVLHQGVYRKTATVSEAVFMITGLTIGAGILGLPYAIAQVGLLLGIFYLIFLGFAVLGLNLMIGEITYSAKDNLQLPGLAGKYLGGWAKQLLTATIILSAYGTLLAYIVGESVALSTLLGGEPLLWGVIFWSLGSFSVAAGLNWLKRIDKIIGVIVIAIIVALSLFLLPHISLATLVQLPGNTAGLFVPFGVILFAMHATPAIAEAHALLPNNKQQFRKALIIGTLIPLAVYVLFTIAVVGVSGLGTTEVATVGLGERFGAGVLFAANIFAILAMGTCFMGLGTALRETLVWDHKIPDHLALFSVISLPLVLFLAGLRSFVAIIDVVGGVFVALEILIMVAVYLRVRGKKRI